MNAKTDCFLEQSRCSLFQNEVGLTAGTIIFTVSYMAYKDRFELQLVFTRLKGTVMNCGFVVGFMQLQPLVIPILGSNIAERTQDETFSLASIACKAGSVIHPKRTNRITASA